MKKLFVTITLLVLLVGTSFAKRIDIKYKTFAVTTKEEFVDYFEYFSQIYGDNYIETVKEAETIEDVNKYKYLIHCDNDDNVSMFFYSEEFDRYFKIYFYRNFLQ